MTTFPLNDYTLIFDLDGTLVDTAPDLVQSLNFVLHSLNLNAVTLTDANHLIGGGARALLIKGLEQNQKSPTDYNLSTLTQLFIADYKTHISQNSAPYDGCVSMLHHCRDHGMKLAVCTNKPEALARQLLDELNLTSLFQTIIGGNSLPVSKPDPRPLRAAIARAGGNERRAILIGDSITDLNTARNANIPFIGVGFGYNDPPMASLARDFGPNEIFMTHYNDLSALLTPFIDSLESANTFT